MPYEQKKFLGLVLYFCLSHNFFWYGGKFYTQKRGVAKGAKFEPSCTNLFMSEWVDRFIFGRRKSELLFYKRFIDDLLFIWVGSETSVREFTEGLNLNNNNIQLDCHWSKDHVNYLDVTIML